MDRTPLVSVLIPTYNRADRLPQAVESVVEQNVPDLEIIIVDDGSTDGTGSVVEAMSRRGINIQYIWNEKNRGAGYSRDRAFHIATGKYIAFIDSDDRWLPGKLGAQVDILDRYSQIDFLFSDFINVDGRTGARANCFDLNREALAFLQTCALEDGLWLVEDRMIPALLQKMFVQLGTVLLRRDVFETAGSFDESLRGPEDFEFCLRAAVFGCRFAFTDIVTQERIKNADSVTASQASSWRSTQEALRIFRKLCVQESRPDLLTAVDRSMRRANRNAILAFGRIGDRRMASGIYYKARREGDTTIRTMAVWLLALAGEGTILRVKSGLLAGGKNE